MNKTPKSKTNPTMWPLNNHVHSNTLGKYALFWWCQQSQLSFTKNTNNKVNISKTTFTFAWQIISYTRLIFLRHIKMVSCAIYPLTNFIVPWCQACGQQEHGHPQMVSSTNGHKIVPGLISLNRALRKNHPHQRDQKKFSKTSMQVLYAGMDSLSYSAPWEKAKPQITDGIKMKEDPLDIYNSHFQSMCFLAPPHSCSCPTLVE